MNELKPGDVVEIVLSQERLKHFRQWHGFQATVLNRESNDGNTWVRPNSPRPDDLRSQQEFWWPTGELHLVFPPVTDLEIEAAIRSIAEVLGS